LEKAKLAKEQAGKYTAKDIKVLMSLKTYTELSKEKQQTWLDFQWAFKDIQQYGIYTIGEVQELVAKGENLVRDYLATAKAETISRAKRWNSLSEKEQKEFIAYLSRKRVAERKRAKEGEEELSAEAKEWEAEIERELNVSKYHEERGKIKCQCSSCEQREEVMQEVKKEVEEELKNNPFAKEDMNEKAECANCGKVRELNEDDVCSKCEKELGE